MNLNLEDYEIISQLGKGGMGEVYLARDKKLGRKVAIKVLILSNILAEEQKNEIIERFKREARSIAQLSHPNIVKMHELRESNGTHYMIMEFLEGKSLGSIIEDEKIIPIDKCVSIGIQMCKALSYIHSNSIIHRDIKPDNIILLNDDIVKLTDFGIAKSESDQLKLTQDSAILGSVMYISPEQLKSSKEVDNKADIYSFGVSFYQMITGRLPYDGETVGEIVGKILNIQNPPMPRTINKNIPFELEAVIMKAINKNIEKRYQNAEDMERDLFSIQAGHSFRKTTIADKNTLINNLKNTSINEINKNTKIELNHAKILETATINDKLLNNFFRTIFLFLLIAFSFNIFYEFFISLSVLEISEKIAYTSIQGPSSKYLLHSIIFKKTLFFSFFFNIFAIALIGFIFPMDSKGITRTYKFTSEIISIILLPIIGLFFTYFMFMDKNTFVEYSNSYQEAIKTEIKSDEDILQKKGKLSISEIIDYKRRFFSAPKGKLTFDEPAIQLKNIALSGDHINLYVSKPQTNNDPVLNSIKDLFDNVFIFENPVKETYSAKLLNILSTSSNGKIITIPDNIKIDISKNNNIINAINITWDNNLVSLKRDSVDIKFFNDKFNYPTSSSSNIFSFNIENITDKMAIIFIYGKEGDLVKSLNIKPTSNENIKIKSGDYEIVILNPQKEALLQYGKFFINEEIL